MATPRPPGTEGRESTDGRLSFASAVVLGSLVFAGVSARVVASHSAARDRGARGRAGVPGLPAQRVSPTRQARHASCPPATVPDTLGPPPPYARSGRLLVTNQNAGSVTLVDLATGALTNVPVAREPHGAAVSPDGRWGVVTDYGRLVGRQFDGNTVVVLDMSSGRVVRRIGTGEYRAVHDVAFPARRSDRVFVTAQRSRRVLEVDILRGVVVAAIETRGESSHSLALSEDARTLFTSNEESGTLSHLSPGASAFVAHVQVPSRPLGIALTPDGREVWSGSAGVVRVFDVATRRQLAQLTNIGRADRLVISRDGRVAAMPDMDCDLVHVADVGARRFRGHVGGLGRPHMVDIAPDGRTAFVTLGRSDEVAVVDLARHRVLRRFPTQAWPDDVAWGPGPP
jgi:DNA-binding beta-propeller fold protein YncE